MKQKLLFLGIITSMFSSAQINVNEGFETTTYPGFTNTGFFRSSVISACVGTYTINREFYSATTGGSTVYSSTASNGGKLDISFKYKAQVFMNNSVNGTMKVEYSVDGGQNYLDLGTVNLTSVMSSCATWSTSLPQNAVPAGADFKFRVSGQWTSGDYWLLLDDFKLAQSPFLSANDIDKKENKISPNPFKDKVIIANPESVKSISVSDISGRKLKTINQVSKETNLADLKKGIYILTVQNKDGSQSQTKLIKE